MTTAIELANQRKVELQYLQQLGTVLASSHFFSDAHKAEQAVAKILAGQEFGLGPLEAMRSFHVIDGKVEMSADAQARLVKQSGRYDYRVDDLNDDQCTIAFFEGEELLGYSTFTIGDAERAGIVKPDSAWRKYPKNMLFARALTNGVAWFCPDAISGGRVYAPGEVGGPIEVDALELEPAAVGIQDPPTSAVARDGMGESEGTSAETAGEQDADVPSRGEEAADGTGEGPTADLLSALPSRFWGKVILDPDGCWRWTGAMRSGYGAWWDDDKVHRAHRLTWVAVNGPVPEGLVLDHLCGHPYCVNPEHLEAVTQKENLNRSERYRETRPKKNGAGDVSDGTSRGGIAAQSAGTGEPARDDVPRSDGAEGVGPDRPASAEVTETAPSASTETPGTRSLRRELLRIQHDLRWTDVEMNAYLSDSVGVDSLLGCSLEQLRIVRDELKEIVEATKITKEQKDQLRSLAKAGEMLRAAQVVIGPHVRSSNDLTTDEATKLIAYLHETRGAA